MICPQDLFTRSSRKTGKVKTLGARLTASPFGFAVNQVTQITPLYRLNRQNSAERFPMQRLPTDVLLEPDLS